jgi:antitoxin HicB
MYYHFKIHKEKKGYWAECIELKGCNTEGNALDELKKNMQEALNLYLDEPEGSNVVIPLPSKDVKGKNVVEVPVEPKIAFALYIRMLRIKRGFTQKEAARLLGMKNIYSYQRLESSRRVNPNLTTLVRIKKIFPEFEVDNVLTELIQK